MTAAPTDIPVAGPVDSLEVRWIVSGPLLTAMREWFARFSAGLETREDAYLLRPRLAGLSLKLRDGRTLDVKSYLGSPGILDLPHRCRGRMESWRKWSFRYDPPGQRDVLPGGWSTVRKRRRRSWFPMAAGQDPAGAPRPEPAAQAGCCVELTQASVRGESWWSVGFEATGPAGLLRDALEHAADLMFAQPLPSGVVLSLDKSRSYLDWLSGQHGPRAGDAAYPRRGSERAG